MNNNILVSIELQSCVAHTYIFMKTFRVMFMAYLKFKLSGCPVCCLIILLGSPDRSGACFPSPSVPMVSAARAPPTKTQHSDQSPQTKHHLHPTLSPPRWPPPAGCAGSWRQTGVGAQSPGRPHSLAGRWHLRGFAGPCGPCGNTECCTSGGTSVPSSPGSPARSGSLEETVVWGSHSLPRDSMGTQGGSLCLPERRPQGPG